MERPSPYRTHELIVPRGSSVTACTLAVVLAALGWMPALGWSIASEDQETDCMSANLPHDPQHAQHGPPNRRKAVRIACQDTICQFGPVMDISRGGARILSKKPIVLPVAASINLQIQVHGHTLILPARPVNHRKRPDGRFDVGFEFFTVSEELARDLLNLARISMDTHACVRRTA